MSRLVRLALREGVAVVTIGAQPTAGAQAATQAAAQAGDPAEGRWRALAAALGIALAAPDARALLLRAEPGAWAARPETVGEDAQEDQALTRCVAMVAASAIPVIALFSGEIGGAALALGQAASVRLAEEGARFRAGEIAAGALAGGGLLTRLTRRAGASGVWAYLTADGGLTDRAAMECGLCDAFLSGAAAEPAALAAALRAAGDMRLDARPARAPADDLDMIERLRSTLGAGGRDAALRGALDAVEAALLLPLDEALEAEAAIVEALSQSERARALAHLVAARRRARLDGAAAAARPILRAALWRQPAALAAGLLGAGAQVVLGQPGARDLELAALDIARAQQQAVEQGALTPQRREEDWARLTTVAGPDAFAAASAGAGIAILSGADAAVDGAPPPVSAPGLLLIEGAAVPGAIGFRRLAGLVEIPVGPESGEGLAHAAAAFAAGDEIVLRADLSEALAAAFLAGAERAVLAGASPGAVDDALTGWGFAEGPFARLDREGLARAEARLAAGGRAPGAYLSWLRLTGRVGQAAGGGVWRYDRGGEDGTAGGGTAGGGETEDGQAEDGQAEDGLGRRAWPGAERELAALRAEARDAAGAAQARAPDAGEIVSRLLAELAGAAAAALQAGRALRAGDADLIAVAAIGFPEDRGGPLFQADRAGLLLVRDRLRRLAEEGAPAPAALFDVMIRKGLRFADLDAAGLSAG